MTALNDTFTLVVFLVVGALLLAVWGLVQERRSKGTMEPVTQGES